MPGTGRARSLIAFLSDFGQGSPYPGIVKGVVISIFPEAEIIDISHEIPPGDVELGAFMLENSFHWFPKGTVMLAVVDPEVGSEREGIVVTTNRYIFVGPDNGLIYPAAKKDGIEEVRVIKNDAWIPKRLCETFHGRDVFGPVAAFIAGGKPPSEAGPSVSALRKLHLPGCEVSLGSIEGTCLWVDRFGNVITSIPAEEFSRWAGADILFSLGNVRAMRVATFSELEEEGVGLVPGSFSKVEIVMNMKSASRELSITRGDRVLIERVR